MPDTITPNYGLIKPEVTGSTDTWGSKLNVNFDALDAALQPIEDQAGSALARVGSVLSRTTEDFIFLKTGLDPSLQGPDAVMNNSAVRALLNALCPVGTIAMWGGTVATIPPGWSLCDGRTVGSVVTPNLTDRFVRASGTQAPGVMGGQSNFAYSGVVGGHLLTVAEIPAHNHDVYDPTHYHASYDSGHLHSVPSGGGSSTAGPGVASTFASMAGANTGYGYAQIVNPYAATGISLYNRGGSQLHDHPISMAIPGPNWFPLYYTLVFMMRTQPF